ncbi:ferredoxin [Methanoculleus sp.]|uniref:ferredoxin n=1 Tax=Methanoculleus sp. TaxID=90427 RepID=UPI002FCB28B7
MVKVTIDRPGCISCESCWTLCPDVFEEDPSDGLSSIVEQYRVNNDPAEGEVPDDLADCAIEAADSCPVTVIIVEE